MFVLLKTIYIALINNVLKLLISTFLLYTYTTPVALIQNELLNSNIYVNQMCIEYRNSYPFR